MTLALVVSPAPPEMERKETAKSRPLRPPEEAHGRVDLAVGGRRASPSPAN